MPTPKISVGVMISGRGSNLEALLKKQAEGFFSSAEIACVVSDRADAGGLAVAKRFNIPAKVFDPSTFANKYVYESEVANHFERHSVFFICLAGYMRIVGPTLLAHYEHRILNIHPSLLPSFPGLNAQRQALDYGVRYSGCTVHFVNSGIDTGPIILQRSVDVKADDTEETLTQRILRQEHQAYPLALQMVTERPWHIDGRVVRFD